MDDTLPQLLASLIDSMSAYGTYGAYLVVVGILLVSGFGAPIPEDVPLLLGGVACAMGLANIWIMVPVTFIAVLGADMIMWGIGRRYGQHVPNLPVIRRYLTRRRMRRAHLAFHRHGGKTLFIARFLPGVRATVYFSAGVFRIPCWKMLFWDGLAALLSVPAIVLAGYFGAQQFEKIKLWTGRIEIAIAVVAVVAIALFIVFKLAKRRVVPVTV